MRLADEQQSFELRVRQIGDEDAGLRWATTEIRVQRGKESFNASGPWLTLDEIKHLIDLLGQESPPPEAVGRIEFIEPNFVFGIDANLNRLTVLLDLEARPKWLASGELSFAVTQSQRKRLAEDLAKDIGELSSSQ